MKNIIVPKRVHNHLLRVQNTTGNKHELTILKLIKDSKEYRSVYPDASYPEPLKWKSKDLPRVEVSDGCYDILIDLRIEAMKRAHTVEYSFTRLLNDLLHDSEKLNEIEQSAMSEGENGFIITDTPKYNGKIMSKEEGDAHIG